MVCIDFNSILFYVCTVCSAHHKFFICWQGFEHCGHLKRFLNYPKVKPTRGSASFTGSHVELGLELASLPLFFCVRVRRMQQLLLNSFALPSLPQQTAM